MLAAARHAELVRSKHFTDRQQDLKALHPDTPRKKRRSANAHLKLVDQDTMIKGYGHERVDEMSAAAGGVGKIWLIQKLGCAAKGIPARPTDVMTYKENKDKIRETAERHVTKTLDMPVRVKRTFSI